LQQAALVPQAQPASLPAALQADIPAAAPAVAVAAVAVAVAAAMVAVAAAVISVAQEWADEAPRPRRTEPLLHTQAHPAAHSPIMDTQIRI
jgi:hypothetical protein